MAKQKSSQSSEPADDMASDLAEFDQADQAARAMAPNTLPDATIDPIAYRQDIAVDVFRALVHGIRIEMKPDQQPGSFAERVMQVHAELMLKAEQAGIIPTKE